MELNIYINNELAAQGLSKGESAQYLLDIYKEQSNKESFLNAFNATETNLEDTLYSFAWLNSLPLSVDMSDLKITISTFSFKKKIGVISDLHLNTNGVSSEQAKHELNKLIKDNDLTHLFIAGDTFNNPFATANFVESFNENSNIKIYFILGNHEFWRPYITWEFANGDNFGNYYFNNKVVEISDSTVVLGLNGWFDYSYLQKVSNIYNDHLGNWDNDEIESFGRTYFDLARIGYIGVSHEEAMQSVIDSLHTLATQYADKRVIFVTHFVAHKDFLTYKDDRWNMCNAFMGSVKYHDIIVEHENITDVVFGHTHTRHGSKLIDNVNYHCRPLGYRDFDKGLWQDTFAEELKKSITIIEYE